MEEQSEKAESCLENLWNEIQLREPQRQEQTQEVKNTIKQVGKLGWFMSKDINRNIPHHEVNPRGLEEAK